MIPTHSRGIADVNVVIGVCNEVCKRCVRLFNPITPEHRIADKPIKLKDYCSSGVGTVGNSVQSAVSGK